MLRRSSADRGFRLVRSRLRGGVKRIANSPTVIPAFAGMTA
ncbi:hypothetical protein [Lysobacter gummosus]